MNYLGMPMGMWALYKKSFRSHLVSVLGCSEQEASAVTAAAKPKYREIIAKLPAFEKGDRFKMNIVNCAMLAAFLLSMKEKPAVETLTDFYAQAMMNAPTRWFCRMGGRQKFSGNDLAGMKATAALKAADRNPYSWNMTFLPYEDGSGYEARFTKCGHLTFRTIRSPTEKERAARSEAGKRHSGNLRHRKRPKEKAPPQRRKRWQAGSLDRLEWLYSSMKYGQIFS